MQKKLWLALVEHNVFPGTRAKLLHQEQEPTNAAILAHFAGLTDGEKPSKVLAVTGLFDLNAELQRMDNLDVFAAAAKELIAEATHLDAVELQAQPDEDLTADQLNKKYNPNGGGEHPEHTRKDWMWAVSNENTTLGYWDWLEEQIRESIEDAEADDDDDNPCA